MLHDTYYGTPQVLEAVRRLPSEVREARDFRMKRALQLSLQKVYLPKEEWTQVEDVRDPTYPIMYSINIIIIFLHYA